MNGIPEAPAPGQRGVNDLAVRPNGHIERYGRDLHRLQRRFRRHPRRGISVSSAKRDEWVHQPSGSRRHGWCARHDEAEGLGGIQREPAADHEPASNQGPVAQPKPEADHEPASSQEPFAQREPESQREPSCTQGPFAQRERLVSHSRQEPDANSQADTNPQAEDRETLRVREAVFEQQSPPRPDGRL
jgi:hypothetical protein